MTKLNPLEHEELQIALRNDLEIPGHLLERFDPHVRSCRQCQHILKTSERLRKYLYKNLKTAHLSQEQLLSYVNSKPKHVQFSLPASDRQMWNQHHAHVKECSLCRMRARHLQNELALCAEIVQKTAAKFFDSGKTELAEAQPAPPVVVEQKEVTAFWSRLKLVVVVASLSLCGLAGFKFYRHQLPEYYALVKPSQDSFRDLQGQFMGKSGQGFLDETGRLLREEQIQPALEALAQIDERGLSPDELLQAGLYELMATLKASHSTMIGPFFPEFDRPRVQIMLRKMETILSQRQDFEKKPNGYWGMANFYCAKACLILEDRQRACDYLGQVIGTNIRHDRKDVAITLARELGCAGSPAKGSESGMQ